MNSPLFRKSLRVSSSAVLMLSIQSGMTGPSKTSRCRTEGFSAAARKVLETQPSCHSRVCSLKCPKSSEQASAAGFTTFTSVLEGPPSPPPCRSLASLSTWRHAVLPLDVGPTRIVPWRSSRLCRSRCTRSTNAPAGKSCSAAQASRTASAKEDSGSAAPLRRGSRSPKMSCSSASKMTASALTRLGLQKSKTASRSACSSPPNSRRGSQRRSFAARITAFIGRRPKCVRLEQSSCAPIVNVACRQAAQARASRKPRLMKVTSAMASGSGCAMLIGRMSELSDSGSREAASPRRCGAIVTKMPNSALTRSSRPRKRSRGSLLRSAFCSVAICEPTTESTACETLCSSSKQASDPQLSRPWKNLPKATWSSDREQDTSSRCCASVRERDRTVAVLPQPVLPTSAVPYWCCMALNTVWRQRSVSGVIMSRGASPRNS